MLHELWKNIKPSISYFHIFGCYCYILNNKEKLGKFDPKSDKAIFLGYSTTSKGYRVYNLKTQTVEISMHIIFDEYDEHSQPKESEDTEVSSSQNVSIQNVSIQNTLRVATRTHKIVCVLANWTKDVHAPGLAVDKPVFDDPTVFESEPSSDSGDSTP